MLPRSMRLAAALGSGVFVLVSAAGPAPADEPHIAASVSCLGTGAYRLELTVVAPEWKGALPQGGEAIPGVQLFALRGGFGMPQEVEPPAQHDTIELQPGSIVWASLWVTPSMRACIDFNAPAGALQLDFECIVDVFQHIELGWDRWGLLASECTRGRLAAVLPATPGASVPLVAPVGVDSSTWSRVKATYR